MVMVSSIWEHFSWYTITLLNCNDIQMLDCTEFPAELSGPTCNKNTITKPSNCTIILFMKDARFCKIYYTGTWLVKYPNLYGLGTEQMTFIIVKEWLSYALTMLNRNCSDVFIMTILWMQSQFVSKGASFKYSGEYHTHYCKFSLHSSYKWHCIYVLFFLCWFLGIRISTCF